MLHNSLFSRVCKYYNVAKADLGIFVGDSKSGGLGTEGPSGVEG